MLLSGDLLGDLLRDLLRDLAVARVGDAGPGRGNGSLSIGTLAGGGGPTGPPARNRFREVLRRVRDVRAICILCNINTMP